MATPDRVYVVEDVRRDVSPTYEVKIQPSDESLLLEELADKQWDWRTLSGLARSTGLSRERVEAILYRHKNEIESREHRQFGALFRMKDTASRPRSLLDTLDRILDYISFGKRRIAQS